MGVLKWVEFTVSDLSYFERQMENLHLMLLDEVIYSNFYNKRCFGCIISLKKN